MKPWSVFHMFGAVAVVLFAVKLSFQYEYVPQDKSLA
jgi:hypothetical protein